MLYLKSLRLCLMFMVTLSFGLTLLASCRKNETQSKNTHGEFNPDKPLDWAPLNKDQIDCLNSPDHPIVVSCNDATFTKTLSFQYYLEYSMQREPNVEFRKFAHINNVEFRNIDYRWTKSEAEEGEGEFAARALASVLNEQYPDAYIHEHNLPQFVLAIPGVERLVMINPDVDDAELVMEAINKKGDVPVPEFPAPEYESPNEQP